MFKETLTSCILKLQVAVMIAVGILHCRQKPAAINVIKPTQNLDLPII